MKRCDVFITTKILFAEGSVDKTYKKLLDSVHKIDGKDGYVDLFLVHTASGGSKARKEMWQALERLKEDGKTRSIGVSNWGIEHIQELKSFAKIYPPHVNQIEVCVQIFSTKKKMLTMWILAPSILPATRSRRFLQQESHYHRGILPSGP